MEIPVLCPTSEISEDFLKGMVDRMTVSYHKYGRVENAYVAGVDFMGCAWEQMKHYRKTANTEALIDAANYLMMEFLYPSVKGATFKATDSDESIGRKVTAGHMTHKSNFDLI